MEWPARVQGALRSIPGVSCAHVDFDARTATAYCREGCDREALLAALRLRGYDGTVK